MTAHGGMRKEAVPSWLDAFLSCCGDRRKNKLDRFEKDEDIWPVGSAAAPPPSVVSQPPWMSPGPTVTTTVSSAGKRDNQRGTRGIKGTRGAREVGDQPPLSRSSLSVRRHFRPHGTSSSSLLGSSSSRRPYISPPTNFRHLQSDFSSMFPPFPSQPSRPGHPTGPQRQRSSPPPNAQYAYEPQPRRSSSFKRLELPLVQPGSIVSPLSSAFDKPPYSGIGGIALTDDAPITPPPRAYTRSIGGSTAGGDSNSLYQPGHDRSYSSMSFHIPRRPVPGVSALASAASSPGRSGSRGGASGSRTEATSMTTTTTAVAAVPASVPASVPAIPPRSRLRSYSSPAIDNMVERIASAMIEVEILQSEIESVMERQSLYANSRPSTAYGQDFDDLPSVPAIPAAAPSFAERLSTERPQTAPPRHSRIMSGGGFEQDNHHSGQSADHYKGMEVAAAYAKRQGPRINGQPVDVPLAPPLPLVLRPPLRKKKSFSRVSNWLFPASSGGNGGTVLGFAPGSHSHHHGGSLDSVTNQPRPVRQKDGFYQCLVPREEEQADTTAAAARHRRRASLESLSSVDTLSTWTTEREGVPAAQAAVEEKVDVEDSEDDAYYYDGSSPVTTTRLETPTTSTTMTMTPVVTALAPAPVSRLDKSAAGLDADGQGILFKTQSVGVAF